MGMENAAVTVTPRQRELMTRLEAGRERFGVAPSYEELAEEMGLSLAAVVYKVKALTKKGLVQRTVGVHRSTRLTPEGRAIVGG